MAAAATGFGVSGNGTWMQHNKKMKSPRGERSMKVTCVASRVDPYKTLRIDRTASESEVRKAFRKLALKYHPDVCRGSNCGVQFHKINEAYDIALNNIRLAEQEELIQETYAYNYDYDEEDLGEYMGWEAGGYPSQDSRQQVYIYEDENSNEWTGWDGSYPNAAAA